MIRFPLAWLMASVILAALDFRAIRAGWDHPNGPDLLLCTAILPMANAPAVGLLIGHRYRGSRQFLVGFEAFGAAVVAFLIAAILSDKVWVWSYPTLFAGPVRAILGPISRRKWSPSRLLPARSLLSLWATVEA